jgi:CRISPR/Cas system-associated protein Cas5 (RAMP superfamily)
LLLVLPGLSLQGVQGPTGKERREQDEKGEERREQDEKGEERMRRDGWKMDRIGRDETGLEEKGWDQWKRVRRKGVRGRGMWQKNGYGVI